MELLSRRRAPLALVMTALAVRSARSAWAADTGLMHDADVIHQDVQFAAPRARVYDALTVAAQFDKVSKLGKAARTMNLPKGETRIDAVPGGAFSIFGGFITGRQIELVPGRRIVQTWREAVWDEGVYSLLRFEFSDDGAGTKLAFDQSGFPKGAGAGLAEGWYNDYWTPLQQFLA